MMRKQIFTAAFLLLAALPAVAARTPGSPLRPGYNMFTKQQDEQLGQEAAAQVKQKEQVVDDPFLQSYVNKIGQRLAATAEAKQSGFPFTFTVVNDPSVNAFALPGGPMFINVGLLKVVDNEAQLAGVMAHEMSHVILRHGTNQASKANLVEIPAILAGLIGGGSMLGKLGAAGVSLGANSILLKFSRTAESEADALGSHLMSEAGYNPVEMARFFEKIQALGGARGPQILSDHPNPGNRDQAIQAEVRTLPRRSYGFETGEFARMKEVIQKIPAGGGRSIRNGAEMPQGQPSGDMKQLKGKYFSVAYPANWSAYGGGDSGSVTFAPQNGLVQGARGNTQVGYGAILSYFFPENNRVDLVANTSELVHHLHAENPSMQVAGDTRKVRIDGHDGLVTNLKSDSPFGGEEMDALLTVSTEQGLFYLVFIAPQSGFRNLQASFDSMAQSVHFNR